MGLGLDEALYNSAGTALSGVLAGVGNVALYGAIAGGVSGILQALLLRRRIAHSHLWAPASMAGGAIGFILGTVAGEAASNALGLRVDVYTEGAIIQVSFGAFCGAGIGVAQWLLIRGGTHNAGVWVPASMLGLTLGSTIPGVLWLALRAPVRDILALTLESSITVGNASGQLAIFGSLVRGRYGTTARPDAVDMGAADRLVKMKAT